MDGYKNALLDGIEASSILRNKFNYSGVICAIIHEECDKVGINDVLTKPISINAVKQMAKSLSEKQ